MNCSRVIGCLLRVVLLSWLAATSVIGWAFYEIRNASNIMLKFDTLDPVRGTWRTWEICQPDAGIPLVERGTQRPGAHQHRKPRLRGITGA